MSPLMRKDGPRPNDRGLEAHEFLHNRLDCTEYELETAVERAMQLYPEIRIFKVRSTELKHDDIGGLIGKAVGFA